METKEIVQEKTINVLEKYNTHNERVLKVIGKLEGKGYGEAILKLCTEGFVFVKKDIEAKFQYRAGINGSYNTVRKVSLLRQILGCTLGIVVAFSPLIPSVITHNYWLLFTFPLSLSFCGGIVTTLTLNTEIAVNYVGDIPDFVLDNMEKVKKLGFNKFMVYSCQPLPTEQILLKVDPVMIAWFDDNETGIIVGIWDRDKEITI